MSCGQQNGRTAAALVLLLCWPFAVRSAPRQDSMSTEAKRLGLNEDDYVSKYLAWGNVLAWKTMNGTRPFIETLAELPMDAWTPPAARTDAQAYAPDPDGASHAADEGRPSLASFCAGTTGSWCLDWMASMPVASSSMPRGRKACPKGCNGVGVCNYDLGVCQCPAGWSGDDCMTEARRPCTNRHRNSSDDLPVSHILANGHDANLTDDGWAGSRCAGYCDDSVAACFCGYNSTYGRVPAPDGAPPGSPPLQLGRPISNMCKPKTDVHGNHLAWGGVNWEDLYGPEGWCQADAGKLRINCGTHSGFVGPTSEVLPEAFCLNQCNGRGQCLNGFCKCDQGWYGTACDRLAADAPLPDQQRPNMSSHTRMVWKSPFQHPDGVLREQRRRPLIYVYDLPAEYNTRVLQYTEAAFNDWCTWRTFSEHGNSPHMVANHPYFLDSYLHEMLLISPHRTMNPDEADFFYVPVYASCLAWPTLGWADVPWYWEPQLMPRPMHMANLVLEAKRWVQARMPYWDRRGGRDHIFLMAHDEGACPLSREVYDKAIILTHWGRTDLQHESQTAYWADNYSIPVMQRAPGELKRRDWRESWQGHPCYTPGKDLILPALQILGSFLESPLLGQLPLQRDILMFFSGDVGMHRAWWYSRGIRQSLYRLAVENGWRKRYGIVMGNDKQFKQQYGSMAARSKFCLVTMGDGWSARSEFAILHGCVPVLINDGVEPVWDGVVDWSKFSVRVPQSRVAELPQILLAINETRLLEMQRALSKVWHRFAYTTSPLIKLGLGEIFSSRQHHADHAAHGVSPHHPFAPRRRFPRRRDAFHTLIQWLHSRIPYTLGL